MVAATTTTPIASPIDPSRLIDLLTSPDLSLREIADQLGVSLERLTLLIGGASNDESAPILTAAAAACTTRARLAATALLPRVLRTLRHSLDDHEAHIKANTATDAHHERARRACTLILRIANTRGTSSMGFQPMPRPTGLRPVDPPSSPNHTNRAPSRLTQPTTPQSSRPTPTDAELLALIAQLEGDQPEVLSTPPDAPVSPDIPNTPDNSQPAPPPSAAHLHTSSPAHLPIPSPFHLHTPPPAPSPHLRDPPFLPSGP
ncbi:MAG TPA: hypothetical protein VHN77_03800 [Phycisphaerales bacterium]|nr:hypothetical protein [Phycisphaerales bacterium]